MRWLRAVDRSRLMLLLGAVMVGGSLYPYCIARAWIPFSFTVPSFTVRHRAIIAS